MWVSDTGMVGTTWRTHDQKDTTKNRVNHQGTPKTNRNTILDCPQFVFYFIYSHAGLATWTDKLFRGKNPLINVGCLAGKEWSNLWGWWSESWQQCISCPDGSDAFSTRVNWTRLSDHWSVTHNEDIRKYEDIRIPYHMYDISYIIYVICRWM